MSFAKTTRTVVVVFLFVMPLIASSHAAVPAINLSTSTVAGNAGWTEIGAGSASGGGISNNSGGSYAVSLVVALDDTPYVAWDDDSSGVAQIYTRRWNGAVWEEVGTGSASGSGISGSGGASRYPSTAIAPDSTPYVAWADSIDSPTSYIYVRRWNGSGWEEVGTGSASGTGISGIGYANWPSMAIAPDGTPYVAWADYFAENVFIRRWNGSNWVEVGAGSASNGGISDTGCAYSKPSVAVAPSGTPYVAWQDAYCASTYPQIYIRRWNGTIWEEVGAGSASGEGLSNTGNNSNNPSLAFGPAGTLYVLWEEANIGGYIRQWNGSNWAEVGAGSASGAGISGPAHTSLAVAPNGRLYVAWTQHQTYPASQIYIRQWNGSSWAEAGAGSASGNGISDTSCASWNASLAVGPDATPYVAWMDNPIHEPDDMSDEIYVRQGPPSLDVQPSEFVFLGEAGGTDPRSRTISVTGSSGVLTWTATLSPTVSWLSLTPISGTAPSAITVTASTSGLSVADYTADIIIDGGYAMDSPQNVAVTLVVADQIHELHLPLVLKGY